MKSKGNDLQEEALINSVGHIGLAVQNIGEFLNRFCSTFLIPIPEIHDVAERRMKVAMVDLGNIQLEVLEDYSQDGMIACFVNERGNAIHHFCLISDDIATDVAALGDKGARLMDRKPKFGLRGKRIAFVSPEVLDGITVELSEP